MEEDDEGRCLPHDYILLGIPPIMPSVEVRHASYGHPTNPKQVWNAARGVLRGAYADVARRFLMQSCAEKSD